MKEEKYYKCFRNYLICTFDFNLVYTSFDKILEDAYKSLNKQELCDDSISVYNCTKDGCVLDCVAEITLTNDGLKTKFIKE